MGLWEEVKEVLKEISLVKIKNEVHLHGDINLPFKGDTIHYSVPPEARQKIEGIEITPELQKEYDRKFVEYIKDKESKIAPLSEKERLTNVAGVSVSTAVEVMTTTTTS